MSFSSKIAESNRRTMKRVGMAQRKIAIDVFSTVVRRTPVQDGFLRGSFKPSIGAIMYQNALIADESGSATIAAIESEVASLNILDDIYLSTNLPYAYKIEYLGHSPQRPQGMIRSTIAEFQPIVAAVARSLMR